MAPDSRHTRITDRVSTRLKLKQLRLLVAISERMSILHAARDLNISQPAATKLVKDLETDFGVVLFDRTNRGVVPTEYGAALVRHGKLILAQIAQAAQELDDLSEGTGGRVVVGTLLAASASLLPAAIRALHADRPNVTIAIREGTNDVLMPALRLGDVDMVVGRLPEYRHRAEVIQESLFPEEIRVVARPGHPLSRQKTVGIDRLASANWILPPPDTTLRRQIDREFLDRGLAPPANALESVSFLINRTLLEETDFLAAFPYHVIRSDIADGRLCVIRCDLNRVAIPVGVSYRRHGGLSPAAAGFLEKLRQGAADLKRHPEYGASFTA